MKNQMPLTNWMWLPGEDCGQGEESRLVYFRKKIPVLKRPEICKIKISADSRYKLYVNGALVEIGPCKGDKQIWYFDEVDIAPWMKDGENVVAVEVLRYPAVHKKGNFGVFRTDTPGLYVECTEVCGSEERLKREFQEEGVWKCYREKNFHIHAEAPYFSPLMILEERTGEEKTAGWKLAGYDDREWQQVKRYHVFEISGAVSPGNLNPRRIPSMRKDNRRFVGLHGSSRTDRSQAEWERMLAGNGSVRIPAGSTKTMEINAGELTTGYLSLRIRGGEKADVRILTSESYVQRKNEEENNPAKLPCKKNRCDWENGYLHGFTDTYHVGGYGNEERTEDYEPFWFRTFRFIKITVTTGEEPLEIVGFDYKETGYPLEVKTWVRTSDASLEPVWDISLRTLKRCMHETYEDCPFYEQLQYAMDSRSQILYTYMVAGDDRLARNCMDDFRRSQRYDGMLNCSYPTYEPNIIPGFSVYYILMLYDHMMYFGDKEFLRGHMGAVDGILEFFHRNLTSQGLVGKVGGMNTREAYWSFIDWTSQWDQTTGMPSAGLQGPITMESLLYVMGLTSAADILEYLERRDTAKEYRSRAAAVRAAVNRYCTDENGMYLDGPGVREYSQHCQVFALLTDTVSVELGRKYLKQTLENPKEYAQCSVAMAYYLFRAMEKAQIYEETDKIWNLWRQMVKNNLTTCVEDSVGERSDCHAWGALALYELPAVVLGVHPGAPGYQTIEVAPQTGYYQWAEGEVITPWGMVKVSWNRKKNGQIERCIEYPEAYRNYKNM